MSAQHIHLGPSARDHSYEYNPPRHRRRQDKVLFINFYLAWTSLSYHVDSSAQGCRSDLRTRRIWNGRRFLPPLRRQEIQPEQRHKFGHNILDLGVCLLETGFREPSFTSESTVTISTLHKKTTVRLHLIEEQHADRIEQPTWPAIVLRMLLHLAKSEIPRRMQSILGKVSLKLLSFNDFVSRSCASRPMSVLVDRTGELFLVIMTERRQPLMIHQLLISTRRLSSLSARSDCRNWRERASS